jgi:hypothetical protein
MQVILDLSYGEHTAQRRQPQHLPLKMKAEILWNSRGFGYSKSVSLKLLGQLRASFCPVFNTPLLKELL